MSREKLQQYADSLVIPKEDQAVSFSFHCEIGNIIDSDTSRIDSVETKEKTFLDPVDIPFIP